MEARHLASGKLQADNNCPIALLLVTSSDLEHDC